MTTRLGFIKGVLGLAFTASVALRGAAQEGPLEVNWPKPGWEDSFTKTLRNVPIAVDQLAWQMDVLTKYNASLGRKPFAGIPPDEADRFVEWVKENQ